MKKTYFLCLFCILFFSTSAIFSQQLTFQKTYGGAGNHVGNYLIETGGGYLIAGQTASNLGSTDAYLLRLDVAGNIIWQKSYGGNQEDVFTLVTAANDGGFLAMGETQSQGAGGKDIFLVKTDVDGVRQWSRTLGGFGDEISPIEAKIVNMADGYIISGYQTSVGNTNSNTYMVRINNAGDILWTKAYTSSPNYLVGGFSVGDTLYAAGAINGDGCFAKIDANSGHIWSLHTFPEIYNDALYNIRPTQDGNFLLSDATWTSSGNTELDVWVVKIKPDATVLWSKVYGQSGFNLRGAATNVSDGGFILAPFSIGFAENSGANLVRIDADGNILWSYIYGGPSDDQLSVAIQASDGGFIAIGSTFDPVNGDNDILLVKTNADGLVQGCSPDLFNLSVVELPAASFERTLTELPFVESVNWTANTKITTLAAARFCENSAALLDTILTLCPNQSILLGGITYFAPAVVLDTLSGMAGSPDTIVTYTLVLGTQPSTSDTILLCPGSSITIGGIVYNQPGTVFDTVPSFDGGCDTLVTYTLLADTNPQVQRIISFCAGDSVVLNGETYTEPGQISYSIPAVSGCDTLVQALLQYAPQPELTKTIAFCEGASVIIDSTEYFLPGTVPSLVPAITGCDTLLTYILEYAPHPTVTRTISFCPGDSVMIGGTTYSQPGTVAGVISATTGCDTLATYVLEFAAQPTRSQTVEFCSGDTVTIGGQTYTQPVTFILAVPSTTGGCDTLVTYTLQHLVPSQPTSVTLTCPANISVEVAPGQLSTPVTYNQPIATSDCPCPGIQVSLQQGLASGSNFPQGVSEVCYSATDSCGNSKTCCFNVQVEEIAACDVKQIGCIRYELLSITQDAQQRKTYRIRTTNNCANRLIYVAIQIPDGTVATSPLTNTSYTAPSGRTYAVRNPNFSPFYSLRFASVSDSLQNGESDIFTYTLPAQADPDYIHLTTKLEPGTYYEAHLNTFFCPIEQEAGNRAIQKQDQRIPFGLYPNPTNGDLWIDLSAWAGQSIQIRLVNTQGALMQNIQLMAAEQSQPLELSGSLPNGIYFIEVTSGQGLKMQQRLLIQH